MVTMIAIHMVTMVAIHMVTINMVTMVTIHRVAIHMYLKHHSTIRLHTSHPKQHFNSFVGKANLRYTVKYMFPCCEEMFL